MRMLSVVMKMWTSHLRYERPGCNIYVIADIENAVATQSIRILGSPASKPATSYEQGLKRVSDD
jgi:hypothetical protein